MGLRSCSKHEQGRHRGQPAKRRGWRHASTAAALLLSLAALAPPTLGQSVPSTWTDSLMVQEADGRPVLLQFGRAPGASLGIDPSLGEVEQPPLPPSGSFDVRFTGTQLGNGVTVDLRPWGWARRRRRPRAWERRVNTSRG